MLNTKQTALYIIVGIVVTLFSLIFFKLSLYLGAGAHLATTVRLLFLFPTLYIAYSRLVLRDLLIKERLTLKWWEVEKRMLFRISSAVGISILSKIIIEPYLTLFLLKHYPAYVYLSPLIGDFVYGPLLSYLTLGFLSKHKKPLSYPFHCPLDEMLQVLSLRYIISGKLIIFIAKLTGMWKKHVHHDSRGEHFTFIDKCRFAYNSKFPVQIPSDSLNLNGFKQSNYNLEIPDGFKEKSSFTLSAIGDIIPCYGLENSLPYKEIENILFNVDCSVGNLEGPLDQDKKLKNKENWRKDGVFRLFTKEALDIASNHLSTPFSVLNTANNHCLDLSIKGVVNTYEYLTKLGINVVGTNISGKPYVPLLIERNNIKISFISASFGANKTPSEEEKKYVNLIDLDTAENPDLNNIISQIQHSRDVLKADVIICLIHWGYEYELFPTAKQQKIARILGDSGIDLILGHHPHVIQGFEYYVSKVRQNRVIPVYYSLGNLLNKYSARYLCLGMLVKMKFIKGVYNGTNQTFIVELEEFLLEQIWHKNKNNTKVSLQKADCNTTKQSGGLRFVEYVCKNIDK